MANNTLRLATVKATGKRYIVQQIDFRTDRVHCWGEVVSYNNLRASHEGSKAFPLTDVTIVDAPRTVNLLESLIQQKAEELREQGVPFRMRGRGAR